MKKAAPSLLSKIIAFVFGDPKKHSLEHRIFTTVALVNGVTNIIGSLGTFYLPNFWTLFFINFTTGLLFLGMYYLSKFRSFYWNLYWPFNGLILVYLLFVSWQNGGIHGGSHYYLIPGLMIALILRRTQGPILPYAFYLSATAALFFAHYFHPGWFVGFPDRRGQYLDSGLNYLFIEILAGILIYILRRNLNQERKKSDNLLHSILPHSVAEELKKNDRVEPRFYADVTILFTDVVGFTRSAEGLTPRELVDELDAMFRAFDDLAKKHGMEKIKTIGDSYMAAGGLPIENQTHPVDAVAFGFDLLAWVAQRGEIKKAAGQKPWQIRVGLHTGPVVAGVVGSDKFAYDVWGDAVNTASRMESASTPGRINASASTWGRVKHAFQGEARGEVAVKGKDPLTMWFISGPN